MWLNYLYHLRFNIDKDEELQRLHLTQISILGFLRISHFHAKHVNIQLIFFISVWPEIEAQSQWIWLQHQLTKPLLILIMSHPKKTFFKECSLISAGWKQGAFSPWVEKPYKTYRVVCTLFRERATPKYALRWFIDHLSYWIAVHTAP